MRWRRIHSIPAMSSRIDRHDIRICKAAQSGQRIHFVHPVQLSHPGTLTNRCQRSNGTGPSEGFDERSRVSTYVWPGPRRGPVIELGGLSLKMLTTPEPDGYESLPALLIRVRRLLRQPKTARGSDRQQQREGAGCDEDREIVCSSWANCLNSREHYSEQQRPHPARCQEAKYQASAHRHGNRTLERSD
jgi:hypothetical protein